MATQPKAPDNAALWQELSKTDPSQTKGFSRPGGFKGTAIKPMWVWQRLTQRFGPFGVGWGCEKPEYQLVPAGDELMVYCTVSAWHGSRNNELWGVGGDKVLSKGSNGFRTDDEAFKKAFTDALMNAFKFIGVGADVHMGLFDDSKYVERVAEQFAPKAERISDAQRAELTTLVERTGADLRGFCQFYRIGSLPELPAERFAHAKAALEKKLTKDAA